MSIKTPVRIYILWHADFADGLPLARRMYHWFRLPTGEGIPVYFRCWRASTDESPPIDDASCDLNIVIPLVEPNMVASLPWRRYVEQIALRLGGPLAIGQAAYHLLPVALHSTAYQMPSQVTRLNFIRHIDPNPGDDDDQLLTKLTEAMSLRLREAVIGPVTDPIKLFLSHAKADGTEVAKQIKHFIQTETQCHTFFDENDINYGQDFSEIIGQALKKESAGLLVLQGDYYADRPWCRKEIRDFLEPHPTEETDGRVMQFLVIPAVVVINFKGNKTARTIPELGHASCLQWKTGTARSAVVTLLREILFSSFYRLLARSAAKVLEVDPETVQLIVNRPPDPVMIEHLFRKAGLGDRSKNSIVIHHPGHGLSHVEREGLRSIYGQVQFLAFGTDRHARTHCDNPVAGRAQPLAGEVLAVSVSDPSDILPAGIGDDHILELLRAILRPLFERGISLLYGGAPPDWKQDKPIWQTSVNFTMAFLDQLLAERHTANKDETGGTEASNLIHPRLFNLSAWPYSTRIGVEQEAQWINTCSFIRVGQVEAGITDPIAEPTWADNEISREQRLQTALCLSAMRRRACARLTCDTPERGDFAFTTLAHVFVGGKLRGSSGVIPGIWEEILRAFEAKKPTYIVGATRGAAGRITDWLSDPPEKRPPELTFDFFLQHAKDPDAMRQLGDDLATHAADLAPQAQLDALWAYVDPSNPRSPPDNGLSETDNQTLYRTDDFYVIARLVERGLCTVHSQNRLPPR